jgi:type IV pilus assembly protein PilP
VAWGTALLALAACGSEPPAGPTTQDFNEARAQLAKKLEKGKPAPAAQAPAGDSEEGGFAAIGSGYRYDPRGKRDPFRSFEWEQLRLELSDTTQGPLEKFDVSQLTVVGVVWNDRRARALVEDPAGMTYIVGEGTRIGKNEGRVTRIDDNLVVIRETYVDFMQQKTSKDVEMRIRATEGG